MLGYLLSPVLQIEDTNGLPLVNGKVYVYEANTSNLATIYSNYEGTYNTNPAILDLAGHTTIIADDSILYDITIKDADDNLLFSAEDVAVGGEGGSAIVTDVSVQAGNNGITVSQSVVNQTKVFKVYIDYNFVASQSDLVLKQDKLSAGSNISIDNDTISVTGLKTINVTAPLQKTDTVSSWDLSIDTSDIQTTLSAGTNIDEVKLYNGIIDLKSDNCSASINSIAIGQETLASNNYSFAEGSATSAVGNYSHAEGVETYAAGTYSHAEGSDTSAFGPESHTEGVGTYTEVDAGAQSHAEGWFTSAVAVAAHAEGDHTVASGVMSHAEGGYTSAQGNCSHAEGSNTIANGNYSHAEGHETIAAGEYQTVIGKYNDPNNVDVFQIGCGSAGIGNKKNAFVVSPSSQAVSSNNTYVIDEYGSITEYPTTITAKIDEPNTKVWAIMTHVGNTVESDNPEIVSINKNIILPKFFPNFLFKNDPYYNKYFERWDSYYNPGYNNEFKAPYYDNYQGYFTQTASTTDIDNTVDIIAKAKSLGFVPVPENYFTIIPKGENGLYKIDFTLTVKGGYHYNSSNKDELQRCEITPVFSNYSNVVDAYVDYYKGFPTSPAQTQLNRYNFSYYVYRYDGDPADRVALTGLKFYVQNMRWNVSDTYSQFFNLNFRRTKVREYDGPTYKTQDVTIENELG